MSRRIYLTSYVRDDGRRWCGPDIEADDWADARVKAKRTGIPGLLVIGKLVERVEVSGLVVGRA